MERIPQKAPLPCYGLEHDRFDPTCAKCPHAAGCLAHMGSRADKVPLNRIKFDLTPEDAPDKFKDSLRTEVFNMDDPELPHLQRLYCDCFLSVFHKNPTDNISLFKADITANAHESECSVRMFMLANMVAHKIHEAAVITNTEKGRAAQFRAKLLTGALSVKRAKTYQQMCHDQFGTFTLTSLAVLTDSDDKDDMESTMLRSEVTAARWLVRYKIFNGGLAPQEMYANVELELAPEWLAIEQTYIDLILKPYAAKEIKGTEADERHRFNVHQVHCFYKSHLSNQRIALIARQRIMPVAVEQVVSSFNHRLDDFLYPRTPITKPLEFWNSLALTLRHYHCWLYLNGEPSYFTPRRNEKLIARVPRS